MSRCRRVVGRSCSGVVRLGALLAAAFVLGPVAADAQTAGRAPSPDRPRLAAPIPTRGDAAEREAGKPPSDAARPYTTVWPEYREGEDTFLRAGGRAPLPSPRDRTAYSPYGYDELPPPGVGDLPPPGGRPEPAARDRPFVIDYLYIGESEADFPSTEVTMSELGMSFTGRAPLGGIAQLTYRPFFDVLFLKGPGGPEPVLPPQLYKVAIDLQADVAFNETFGLSLGITPGLWSDFHRVGSDDLRLPARALLAARISDDLTVAAGVVYTDNIRRNLLPAFGAFWNVTDRTRVELLFPRSRIVYKIHEDWEVYAAAERGGDTYNISTGPIDEDMEYRDYRVLLGTEFGAFERFSLFAEAGAVFARKFRFDVQPERDIDPNFIVRVGTRF